MNNDSKQLLKTFQILYKIDSNFGFDKNGKYFKGDFFSLQTTTALALKICQDLNFLILQQIFVVRRK